MMRTGISCGRGRRYEAGRYGRGRAEADDVAGERRVIEGPNVNWRAGGSGYGLASVRG